MKTKSQIVSLTFALIAAVCLFSCQARAQTITNTITLNLLDTATNIAVIPYAKYDLTSKNFGYGVAALYGIPLFLAPFVDKLAPDLFNDEWPSFQKLAGCALLGTVSACIGLRAFYDGSYERKKSGLTSHDTQFLSRPATPDAPAKQP